MLCSIRWGEMVAHTTVSCLERPASEGRRDRYVPSRVRAGFAKPCKTRPNRHHLISPATLVPLRPDQAGALLLTLYLVHDHRLQQSRKRRQEPSADYA